MKNEAVTVKFKGKQKRLVWLGASEKGRNFSGKSLETPWRPEHAGSYASMSGL